MRQQHVHSKPRLTNREKQENSSQRAPHIPNLLGVLLTTGVPTPAILGVAAKLFFALARSSFSCCARANSSFNFISASDSFVNCCFVAIRCRSEKCCSRTGDTERSMPEYDQKESSLNRTNRRRKEKERTRVEFASQFSKPISIYGSYG